jgi:nitrogen fixation protein NifU and related proteins
MSARSWGDAIVMPDLSDLYQEVILDHNRQPRNFRRLEAPTHHAEGYNPLCGDRIDLFLQVDGGRIDDLAFQGSGCAISKASASLMTDRLKGCTVDEARELFDRFHRMVTTPPDQAVEDLGKLSALAGVREFPVRVKCASLAWHTLKAALENVETTSTE